MQDSKKRMDGMGRSRVSQTTSGRRSVTTIESRIQQLVKAPNLPSRSYQMISANFEKMAKKYSWINKDGSVYLVSLENLQRYIAYSEAQVKLQSILSYLTAIKDKHEQLGFLE